MQVRGLIPKSEIFDIFLEKHFAIFDKSRLFYMILPLISCGKSKFWAHSAGNRHFFSTRITINDSKIFKNEFLGIRGKFVEIRV